MGLLTDDSSIDIAVRANLVNFKKDMNKAKMFATDTKKKLDKELLLRMQLKSDEINERLLKVKKDIIKFRKEGNKTLRLKASLKSKELRNSLTESNRQIKNYVSTGNKNLSRLQAKFDGVTGSMKYMIKTALGFVGITYAIQKVTRAFNFASDSFRSYETAFAGFRKTLDGTEAEFKAIEKGIVSMSKSIPKSVEELSRIAEVAGQMGIASKDILKFTETTAMLSTAIDGIEVDEAVQIMSRLQDQTGETTGELINQANALVYLGNNYKANEGEILNFANEIKSLGSVIGFSSADLLAFSTVFVDAGINAEAGGTQIVKAGIKIETAVKTSADSLALFAEVSGRTIEQFKKDWNEDSANTFADVIIGMGEAGDLTIPIMHELFGENVRTAKAFLTVAGNSEKLRTALEETRREYEDGTAMIDEFNKKLQTDEAQSILNENRWKAWAGSFGGSMSKAKLAFSDLFLKVIPGGIARAQYIFAKLGSEVNKQGISLKKDFGTIGLYVKLLGQTFFDVFYNIGKNASILVSNIGNAFKSGLPNAIKVGANAAITLLEGFINSIGGGFTKLLAKIPGLEGLGDLGNIKLDGIKFNVEGSGQREFVALSSERTQIIKDEIDAFRKQKDREISIQDEAFRMSADRIIAQASLADKTSKEAVARTEKQIKEQIQIEIDEKTKKLEALQKILEKEDKIGGASSSKKSEALRELIKLEEELAESIEAQNEAQEDAMKNGQELAQEFYDTYNEQAKKSQKTLVKLLETQKELNEELGTATSDKDTEIAERKLEIDERLLEIKQEIKDADGYTEREVLKDERARLFKEQSLVLANLNQKSLDEVKKQQSLSDTEKILESFKIEEKGIKKKLIEVQASIDTETEIYNQAIELKKAAEEKFTTFIKTETDTRISEQERMLINAKRIAAEMAELGFNGKGFKATYTKQVSDGNGGTKTIKQVKIVNYNTINTPVDINKVGVALAREVLRQSKV